MKRIYVLVASLLGSASLPGNAHVVLADPAAAAGSYYKAVFRVGHGCDGSATTAISIEIPAGFSAVKPMPKAGWTLETNRAKLAKPYQSHGKPVEDEVTRIVWKGGPLPDAHYDEFSAMMKLPDAAGKQWFRVSQQCEKGTNEWVEIPAAGQSRRDLKMPAAELDVIAPASVNAAPAEHKH
jgi:uncharacterized protein YcnI